ncbi:MAG: LytTR family DNA-binding domain-containing protein [Lachnospiraceae bacterium]|jgi:DNA-binding LytR/AlgR family response regulator|nr:LytTR family DNA-binding domain-containing protein [Lachnospiraceae bacterium]
MLRIAVCDDETVYLEKVKELLKDFARNRSLDFSIFTFDHPFDLASSTESGNIYQIYLLDIYMPGMTGLALAKDLRKHGVDSPIIFFTTSRDSALEAYGVGAIQYLVKPFKSSALYSAMDSALDNVHSERRKQLIFKSNGSYHTVNTREICYSEVHGNYEYIHMHDEEVLTVRLTAAELFDELIVSGCFIHCGASYIVNLIYVKRINSKSILMLDGAEIPIPRGAFADIKNKYFAYFSTRE